MALPATPMLYPAAPPPGVGAGPMTSTVAAVPEPIRMPMATNMVQTPTQIPAAANGNNETNNAIVDVGIVGADLLAQNGAHVLAKNAPGIITTLGVRSAEVAGNTIGTGASAVISGVGAVIHAKRAREELLADFRDTVAGQLGKAPEAVTQDDLYTAAEEFKQNTVLRDELAKIDSTEMSTPVRATVSAIAGFAAAGVLGVATGGLASIGAMMGGSMVADKVMNVAFGSSDYDTAYTKMKAMKEKLEQGQGISARDIFDVHLVLDKRIGDQVKERMGAEFSTLDEKQQATVMRRDHTKLADLSLYEAYLINSGAMQLQELRADGALPTRIVATSGAQVTPMMSGPVQAANMNTPLPANANFAERVAAERAVGADVPHPHI